MWDAFILSPSFEGRIIWLLYLKSHFLLGSRLRIPRIHANPQANTQDLELDFSLMVEPLVAMDVSGTRAAL